MKVKEIMTRDLSAIEVDTLISEFIYIVGKSGLSSLPVVDEEDRIVGIISERDVIGAVLPGYYEALRGTPFAPNPDEMTHKLAQVGDEPVQNYMTTPVKTIQESEDDLFVADFMFRNNLKILPVVDDEGRLSGLVRRFDLLKSLG